MNWQWLANIIGIGSVTAIDDTGQVQLMQVTEGAAGTGFAARVTDGIKRIMEFGFSSSPPLDAEVVMIRFGADRSCSIVIGTNHRPSRPTGLQPGDTIVYDSRGQSIHFSAAGTTISAAGLPVTIENTSGVHIEGPLTVDGDITGLNTSASLALSAIRTKFNEHDHTSAASGSATSGPNETL